MRIKGLGTGWGGAGHLGCDLQICQPLGLSLGPTPFSHTLPPLTAEPLCVTQAGSDLVALVVITGPAWPVVRVTELVHGILPRNKEDAPQELVKPQGAPVHQQMETVAQELVP